MLEAVILLVFGALLVFAIQETQNRQINETLRLSASQLNAVVDIRAGQYVIQDADKAALMAQGIRAWVLTPEGDIANSIGRVGSVFPLTPLPTPAQLSDQPFPDGEPGRFLVTYLSEGDHHLGTLVLALSLRRSQQLIQQIWLSLGFAIPIVLLLSAVGGLFLANRGLSPVAAITKTARQITAPTSAAGWRPICPMTKSASWRPRSMPCWSASIRRFSGSVSSPPTFLMNYALRWRCSKPNSVSLAPVRARPLPCSR